MRMRIVITIREGKEIIPIEDPTLDEMNRVQETDIKIGTAKGSFKRFVHSLLTITQRAVGSTFMRKWTKMNYREKSLLV